MSTSWCSVSELCRPRVEGVRVSGSPWGTVWTLECEHFTAVGEWADLVALADAHLTASTALVHLQPDPSHPGRRKAPGPPLPERVITAAQLAELRPSVLDQLNVEVAARPSSGSTSRFARGGPQTQPDRVPSVLRNLAEMVASELIYRAAVLRDDFDAATDRISRHPR